MGQYSRLMVDARELALNRMLAKAERLGADGVIGVDLKNEYLQGNEWMESTAVGTAVKFTGVNDTAAHNQAQVERDENKWVARGVWAAPAKENWLTAWAMAWRGS